LGRLWQEALEERMECFPEWAQGKEEGQSCKRNSTCKSPEAMVGESVVETPGQYGMPGDKTTITLLSLSPRGPFGEF
jgi:hypothetical protein